MSKRRSPPAPSQYDPSAPRQTRREQLRVRRKRRSLTWNVIILGTVVLFLAAIGLYAVGIARPGALPGETVIADEGVAVVPQTAATRTYKHYPPSSGDRYAQPAPWGVSTEPLAEPAYLANLARGGVVFLYNCPEACPDLVTQFQGLVQAAPRDRRINQARILVAPYSQGMETQIVALAWGHQLNVQQFDQDLLLRWYKRFLNREGPEKGL